MKILKKFNDFLNESLNNMSLFNKKIDYTTLTNTETTDDILELCKRAEELGTASVCIYPKYVSIAKKALENSKVKVCTVISFPEGTNTIEEKMAETEKAIADGADEIDMVLDYNRIIDTNENEDDETYDYLVEEVSSLVDICHNNTNKLGEKVILKVIVESSLLEEAQTEFATDICLEAGADFIKTSTGKVPGPGAEIEKVKIMYDTIKENDSDMKIKASGGIRSMEDITLFDPYVDRFGMGSASVDALNAGLKSTSSY
jgi:deoxyribose-phosphate aldolase